MVLCSAGSNYYKKNEILDFLVKIFWPGCLSSHGMGTNWYQIDNRTCNLPKVSKFSVEKRFLC